ncbi:MAG: hypothetical protein EOM10_08805 [Opitutae bacterium]|nr:hypothetical protein [Opitutae bacterium]
MESKPSEQREADFIDELIDRLEQLKSPPYNLDHDTALRLALYGEDIVTAGKVWAHSWEEEEGTCARFFTTEVELILEALQHESPRAALSCVARLYKKRPPRETIDEALEEQIQNHGMDKQNAIKFMQLAAGYLRRGIKLPELLGNWLAEALEAAAHPERYVPSAENDPEGAAVLVALGLKGARARAPRLEIAGHFLFLLMDGQFRAQAIKKTAAKFHVSEKTVTRCIDAYKNKLSELSELDWKISEAASRGNSTHEKTEADIEKLFKLLTKHRITL